MTPGESVRHIVTAPAVAHAPHVEAPRTTGTTDPSRPLSRRAFPWGPWPRWVGIAIFVALMLGCTLLALWGASRSDALRHARANTIGASRTAEETDAEYESWSSTDLPALSETTSLHHHTER